MLDPTADVLQKYLARAEALSGADAAALCVEATGDPALHVFGELLDVPSVAALAGTAHAGALDLLRLFAYSTYAEYMREPGKYGAMSDAHVRKLRRLSVVSLASQSNMIAYGQLRDCLGVASVRDVEDAVLDAIYSGLVRARLDQRAEVVEVISAVGRDIPPDTGVADLHKVLASWAAGAEDVVRAIDDNLIAMKKDTATAQRERAYIQQTADNLRANFSTGSLPAIRAARDRDRHQLKPGLPSQGPGASADGWRLGRSIRSRFEL